jgi:hypothetical protein
MCARRWKAVSLFAPIRLCKPVKNFLLFACVGTGAFVGYANADTNPFITERVTVKAIMNNQKDLIILRGVDTKEYVIRPGVGCIEAFLLEPEQMQTDIHYFGRFPGEMPQMTITLPGDKIVRCEALNVRKNSF